MYYLNRNDLRGDPFSKVIFYSVLFHYGIFYLLFGNPFLLLNRDENHSGTGQHIEVRLVSFPKVEEEIKKVPIPFQKPDNGADISSKNLALSKDLLDKTGQKGKAGMTKIAPFEEWREGNKSGKNKPTILEQHEELPDLLTPKNISTSEPSKKIARKRPPHMTGPEDCMLKIVGMVCPLGDIECITAYKEFCASLAE